MVSKKKLTIAPRNSAQLRATPRNSAQLRATPRNSAIIKIFHKKIFKKKMKVKDFEKFMRRKGNQQKTDYQTEKIGSPLLNYAIRSGKS